VATVPILDLTGWYSGDPVARAALAEEVDTALSTVGFLMITGHGVTRETRAAVRASSRSFFDLPDDVKRRYAVSVAGRGWLPPGVEANAYAEGTETPPDLKESFSLGSDAAVGIPEVDDFWFQPNVWPAEAPTLQPVVTDYVAQMRRLADDLLEICAAALGQPLDFFTSVSDHPTHTLNINWYPPIEVVGEPLEGQFRIGPHTDFGTVTILDREPGSGGLQVWTPGPSGSIEGEDGVWEDAPYHPDAFTINTGDLLARWSGDRWTSNRHRVLPPNADAPNESLISLVYFHETNYDTVVHALQPPIGKPNSYEPVLAADFLKRLLDAITVG
jgi:isopenicillin N synthase-like dioxygenase